MKKTVVIGALLLASSIQYAFAGPIDTFRQFCVANAGDPAAVTAAGKKAGFKMRAIGANAAMGFRQKSDESLQVNVATKHKFECAVTTSDIENPQNVTDEFFASLGLKPKKGKATGSVGGKTYIFLHDTRGGEAFVMFSD